MLLQQYTIDTTRAAFDEVFRYAKAMPEDKLDWKPLDAGRSTLELARELAKCPDWAYDIVVGAPMDWSEEAQAAQTAEMNGWATLEACEKAAYEKLERLFALYRDLPDARLAETQVLPFGPGGTDKEFTMAEMMDYPRWNATYHLGQIAYIQTLYGDKAMY